MTSTMINIAEYFLGRVGQKRTYTLDHKPVTTIEFIPDGVDAKTSCALWKLRQTDAAGQWQCDWLLRVEPDGTITEYGDQYPKSRLDLFADKTSVYFTKGHEIRWAEDVQGTLRPDMVKSSVSKYGSYGTYLCKAMLQTDGMLSIYMQQSFGRTDRCVYHCRKGEGIISITYYTDSGSSQTISSEEADVPAPPPPPVVAIGPSGPNVLKQG